MKYDSEIRRVWIDPVAHEKLWAWTRMAKGEVSMLGLVEEADGGPAITDLFLTRQNCSAASTDMDQADVAKLLFDLASAGLEGQLRAWVHSHADMACFWSKTDDDCIEGLGGEPYIVSLVVNRKGETRARVDVFKPVRFVVDELPVQLRVPGLGLGEECRREFLAKVNEAPLFPPLGLHMPGSFVHDAQGTADPFGCARDHRPFAALDLEEMEEAVRRGEMTVDEYIAATEGDGFIDPFVDAVENREVNHARRT
jgi:hypothetical protein